MFWAWVSLLIRSGLIMATGEMLRRLSPAAGAYRHRIVAWSFSLLLVWPAVSALFPQISLPLWRRDADGLVTVTQTTHALSTLAVAHTNWPLLVWLAGAFLSLLPLTIGYLRVWNIARRSLRVQDPQWHKVLAEECERLCLEKAPELLLHQGCLLPFTFGLFRAHIILPSDCLNWEHSRRRMVLMHELMHIRRRDLLWQFVASITTAIWWFQPLCWLNRRNLRQESEAACDAWVLESGFRPSEYASELLHLTRELRVRRLADAIAIAIAQPGDLERRVRSILNTRLKTFNKFPIGKVLALGCLTISASALNFSSDNPNFQGAPTMKKTLISGLLVSAGLIAPNAGAALLPSHAVVSSANQDEQPIRVSGEVEQAKLIHKVNPVYPASAKAAGVQGTVRLDVTISKEGVPVDIHVLTSPSDELSQSAVEAVRQWRYSSTLLNGQPVAVIAEVIVNYTLAK
jgi:TonB family protein